MLYFVLAGVIFLLAVMGWFFFRGVSKTEHPVFVMEEPALPRSLAPVKLWVDRCRADGRLDREEHEKIVGLIREEAERP